MVWTDLSEAAQQSILSRSAQGESVEKLANEYGLLVVSLDRKLRLLRPSVTRDFERKIVNLFISSPLRTMIYSDTHFGEEDEKAIELVIEVAKRFQPDLLIHLGDILDWHKLSRFLHDSQAAPVQTERYKWYFFAERLNAVAPKAKKYAIMGNHDARLRAYLAAQAHGFLGLEELSLDKMLYFDELGYEPICDEIRINPSDDVTSPAAQLYMIHGERARKGAGSSARAESEVYSGASVIMGHAHRTAFVSRRTDRGNVYSYECGTLASLNPHYDRFPDWTQSLMTGIIDNGFFDFDIHKIQNGKIRFGSEIIGS